MLDGIGLIFDLLSAVCGTASAYSTSKRQTEVERIRGAAIASGGMGAFGLAISPFTYTQLPRIGIAQMISGGFLLLLGCVLLIKWRQLKRINSNRASVPWDRIHLHPAPR